MKIIDELSYGVWVYNNNGVGTIGFYKLTGADYVKRLPLIVAFNKKMAGKIEVQDPMAWGAARAHTWKAIQDNGFDKLDSDDAGYAHLAPDGANMTDDDMREYWTGNDCGDKASAEDDQELLNQIGDMMGKERVVPPGHLEWVRGPKYEADTGGSYIKRDDTIMCLGCRTVAFEDEKIIGLWYVDKDHNLKRDLKPTCAEERKQRLEDAADLVATTEAEEEVYVEKAQESAPKYALLLAVMKANEALFEAEAAIDAGYIPGARQLTEAEAAFFAAVDAGAAYVKEAKSDPILVGSKGSNNLVIDEMGLTVIFPDGSAQITIDDLGNTPFATFYVDDRGVRQTWHLRDAIFEMKKFVGWTDPTPASCKAGEPCKASLLS